MSRPGIPLCDLNSRAGLLIVTQPFRAHCHSAEVLSSLCFAFRSRQADHMRNVMDETANEFDSSHPNGDVTMLKNFVIAAVVSAAMIGTSWTDKS